MRIQLGKPDLFASSLPGDAGSFVQLLCLLRDTDTLGAEPLKTDKVMQRMVTFFQKVGIESNDSFQTMKQKLYDNYTARLSCIEGCLKEELSKHVQLRFLDLLDTRKFPIQVTWIIGPNAKCAVAFDALGELTDNKGRWIMFVCVETEHTSSRAVVADVSNSYGGYDLNKILSVIMQMRQSNAL